MELLARAFIPKKIESQNKFAFSGCKTFYSKKHKRNMQINFRYIAYRDSWYKALLLLGQPKSKCTKNEKRLIEIISVRKRRLDDGNLRGGAKPIPDGLTKLGWIYDDSDLYIKSSYSQVTCSQSELYDKEMTIIKIYSLTEQEYKDYK